jgi:hypothetical protein
VSKFPLPKKLVFNFPSRETCLFNLAGLAPPSLSPLNDSDSEIQDGDIGLTGTVVVGSISVVLKYSGVTPEIREKHWVMSRSVRTNVSRQRQGSGMPEWQRIRPPTDACQLPTSMAPSVRIAAVISTSSAVFFNAAATDPLPAVAIAPVAGTQTTRLPVNFAAMVT